MYMLDNKPTTAQQEDVRIDTNNRDEIEYLHRQFPAKTQREVLEAIKNAGAFKGDIVRYLRNNGSGT
jgi:hypothetical protein